MKFSWKFFRSLQVHTRYCCDRKSRAAYAQSFTLWQQATIEFTCHDHSIITCRRHIYVWCCSSCTSRSWWITQSTQHHRRGCNSTFPKKAFAIQGHFAIRCYVAAVLWSILHLSYSSESVNKTWLPNITEIAPPPLNLLAGSSPVYCTTVQRREEVRWRPVQEASSATIVQQRSFGSKGTVGEGSTCDIVGTFRRLP